MNKHRNPKSNSTEKVQVPEIANVLEKMRAHPDNAGIQIDSLNDIYQLLGSSGCFRVLEQEYIQDHQGIELILAAMNKFIKISRVQELGCACLSLSSLIHPKNQQKIASLFGIEAIIRSMQDYHQVYEVQEKACAAISSISPGNKEIQDKICELSGIETIIQTMTKYKHDPNIMQCTCWALSGICTKNAANSHRVSKLGGIEIIVEHLKYFKYAKEVCECILMILADLTEHNPENQKLVYSLQILEHILQVMNIYQDACAIQVHGCTLISILMDYETVAVAITVSDNSTLISNQIRNFGDIGIPMICGSVVCMDQASILAIMLLSKLVKHNEENRTVFGDCILQSAVYCLLKEEHSTDSSVSEFTCALINYLIQDHPKNHENLLKFNGGIVLVFESLHKHPNTEAKNTMDTILRQIQTYKTNVFYHWQSFLGTLGNMITHLECCDTQEYGCRILQQTCRNGGIAEIIRLRSEEVFGPGKDLHASNASNASTVTVEQMENICEYTIMFTIKAIIHAKHAFPDTESIQSLIISVFYELACYSFGRVVNLQSITMLINSMKKYPLNPQVQQYACSILCRVLKPASAKEYNLEYCELIRTSGVLDLTNLAIKNFPDTEEIQKDAVSIIHLLNALTVGSSVL